MGVSFSPQNTKHTDRLFSPTFSQYKFQDFLHFTQIMVYQTNYNTQTVKHNAIIIIIVYLYLININIIELTAIKSYILFH